MYITVDKKGNSPVGNRYYAQTTVLLDPTTQSSYCLRKGVWWVGDETGIGNRKVIQGSSSPGGGADRATYSCNGNRVIDG